MNDWMEAYPELVPNRGEERAEGKLSSLEYKPGLGIRVLYSDDPSEVNDPYLGSSMALGGVGAGIVVPRPQPANRRTKRRLSTRVRVALHTIKRWKLTFEPTGRPWRPERLRR